MVATNVISLQQATRALDFKVITTIAAALALGVAMEATGAATYLANLILSVTGTASPRVVLSTFFLMVALMSNIISTKTCAVLFAPIGLHIGAEIGIDPRIFAITIVFAANCAFATPFAYQTSLLVMGPGKLSFQGFSQSGIALGHSHLACIFRLYSLVLRIVK
jgi:di/tricarboxylate transporter